MRTFPVGFFVLSLVTTMASACHSDQDDEPARASPARKLVPQIAPPLELKKPPPDAAKTASGLAYARLARNDAGAQPKPGDTALVHYTGWRQATGETFFTTK